MSRQHGTDAGTPKHISHNAFYVIRNRYFIQSIHSEHHLKIYSAAVTHFILNYQCFTFTINQQCQQHKTSKCNALSTTVCLTILIEIKFMSTSAILLLIPHNHLSRRQSESLTDFEMNTVLQLSDVCPPNSLLILQCSHSQFYHIILHSCQK